MKFHPRFELGALAFLLLASVPASAEDASSAAGSYGIPAGGAAATGATAIRGAFVHPVVGPELEGATVLLEGGKIAGLGVNLAIPAGAAIFDAKGMHLYPGFIDADTTLGLVEVPTIRGSVDTEETGRINPDLRVEVAVNPSSHLIGVARGGGVTNVLVIPGGDLLAGSAAVMSLSGWTWEEMLVRSQVAVHLNFPRVPVPPPWAPQKDEEEAKKEKEKKLKELNRVFDQGEAYTKARASAAADPALKPVPIDLRLEALLPVIEGKTPLIVSAPDLPTIKSAVEWAEKRKLKMILRAAPDAGRWAPELAKRKIPVLLPETLSLPERSDEPYDTSYTLALRLHEAGVAFCFTSGGSATSIMNLPAQAATAAAYGLDRTAALEAITIAPARILGVEARLGSIEPGKDANLILTDGDPLEGRTKVLAEWIEGAPIDLRSKHVQLYDLWKSRPKPAKAGK